MTGLEGKAGNTAGAEANGPDGTDLDGVEEALALVGPRTGQSAASSGPSHTRAAGDTAPATRRHRATPWPEARALAARIGRTTPRPTRRVKLDDALGQVLAEPLTALCDLPSFDTSAMDGWAVAGPGPWTIEGAGSILAGHGENEPLPDGTAVRIATGARIPPETTAVIRSEHARVDSAKHHLYGEREVIPGQDIRHRGQECRRGDQLLPTASLVTPAVLGMAAAAGYDELLTVARPRVEVLVLGDELLTTGLPHDGLIRDALGPMIAPWLRALGAEVIATRRIGDDADALHAAVTGSDADLLVTTGGTAAGPVDHVHPVLQKAGAELLVDQVAVRPGHPMLLAQLTSGKHLVGLPGNPLAAVSGLLTLVEPLLRGLAGGHDPAPYRAPVRDEVHGHPYDTRLVPFVYRDDRLVPLHYNGPAMLRGIAAADGLAVVPPGGARTGDELTVLDLPWATWPPWTPSNAHGGCFT
ncbi:molybdopterin molybdotransferase MoeA [Streptomyces sp. NPDC058572]|uniref:molybdopterin molybdotransferase MoeA n=1 Tax=Streptomyces sp. NPDC058572 TaxID=3346546 RepID=UPI00365094E4